MSKKVQSAVKKRKVDSSNEEGTTSDGNKAKSQVKPKRTLSIIEKSAIFLTDLLIDFPPGFLSIKLKYPINAQKGGSVIFILALMSYYNNYSLGSYVYLALHGTYGLIWLIKASAFPDASFEAKAGLFTWMTISAILVLYWSIAWIQISGLGINYPSAERIMWCVMLMALGSVLLLVADAQKTFTLKYRKGLINDGLFKYTRNPNYLGEIMIYSSFAFMTGSIYSWMVLGLAWSTIFVLRMITKDVSLRSKEGSEEYFARSSVLLPKIFYRNTFLHYASWALIAAGVYYIYQLGGIYKILLSAKRKYQ